MAHVFLRRRLTAFHHSIREASNMTDIWVVRLPGHIKDSVERIARQNHRTGPDQVRHVVERSINQHAIAD
jgi:hypothetical protein